jgi:PAS domain S-box-containing protein
MSNRTKSGRGATSPLKESESGVGRGGSGGTSRADARRPQALQEGASQVKDDGIGGAKISSPLSKDIMAPQKGENHLDSGTVKAYREQLMRDMSLRGGHPSIPKRPSPILEEKSPSPMLTSGTVTSSTDSTATVRGGTPGVTTARTPSYPFPPMRTPGYIPSSLHKPFTTLSPTASLPLQHSGQHDALQLLERVLSNPSTPASALTFQGADAPPPGPDNPDFPNPNLYDLSLSLSAEPGLDAWWNTLVHIMVDWFRAERVTLAIPADSTDVENVPWGQKATYNSQEKDDLSMGYMARGSSLVPSSTDTIPDSTPYQVEPFNPRQPLRPGLPSRHSFTSYEDKKDHKIHDRSQPLAPADRPGVLRSKSSYPVSASPRSSLRDEVYQGETPHVALNKKHLEEHDAAEGDAPAIPTWESAPLMAQEETQGRVIPVLQALDYEADPLIDHSGIQRVLDRGRVVALTRAYPYLDPEPSQRRGEAEGSNLKPTPRSSDKKRPVKKTRSETSGKLSSLLSGAAVSRSTRLSDKRLAGMSGSLEDESPQPRTPKYEEYEQAPPSPWSQSPAPSPAIRADPKENPFFTEATVDEGSFNPGSTPQDYGQPTEAIGVDNSWTVLHIPLVHPLLSRPSPAFKLDAAGLEQRSLLRTQTNLRRGQPVTPMATSPDPMAKKKAAPIAILSVLSPIIPYPTNLRHAIEQLAPHMATSFSLCRHYTKLEAEVAGLQRRRPEPAGFGAVLPDSRPLASAAFVAEFSGIPVGGPAVPSSRAGSMTSPSDYSGPSRSTPGGTPGWDPGVVGMTTDRRIGASPSPITGDSYFTTKSSATSGRSVSTLVGNHRQQRDPQSTENRSSLGPSSNKVGIPRLSEDESDDTLRGISLDAVSQRDSKAGEQRPGEAGESSTLEVTEQSSQPAPGHLSVTPETYNRTAGPTKAIRRHSQLHSYGADFATTFQSLLPSGTLAAPETVPQIAVPTRSASVSSQVDMPPPSDRLKGLILDSLPAHVFVAMPHTGAVVWVNSRYLSYRGQSVDELASDPWASIHSDDRDEYLKAWRHSIKTGDQFSRTVRIKRFDGAYRWFQARAVPHKDKRNSITQYLGSYMDIHDQHIAELKAARQQEIEASEAKHRLLANLIPQIIFTATEDDGITFANEQWLSYSGQTFEDSLGIGFMDFVHPEDLAKCRIPAFMPSATHEIARQLARKGDQPGTADAIRQILSRQSSSGSSSNTHEPIANELAELAKKGVIKVTTDSNGRPSYTTELRLRTKAGEYRWHLIRCVEIENIDFGNGVGSYFGSATDINDHKLLEAKLKEAMESKGRFLSNMSHEIRTPLIGISGMVSFLQDSTLTEEQRDYTNTIQTSANSLLMVRIYGYFSCA